MDTQHANSSDSDAQIQIVADGSRSAIVSTVKADSERRVRVPLGEHQYLSDGRMRFTLDRERAGYRSGPSALGKLDFCISQLESAETFSAPICWQTGIVLGLSIEEIIGALLHAQEELEGRNRSALDAVERERELGTSTGSGVDR